MALHGKQLVPCSSGPYILSFCGFSFLLLLRGAIVGDFRREDKVDNRNIRTESCLVVLNEGSCEWTLDMVCFIQVDVM